MSIVVPAWNADRTIGTLLRSIADEIRDLNVEVIVADNGSRDNTVQAVHNLTGIFRQLRVVDASSRRGPAAARNVGIKASAADWLAFLDADDVVLPGWGDASVHGVDQFAHAAGAMIDFRDGEALPLEKRSPAAPPSHGGYLPYAGGAVFYADKDTLLSIGGFPEDYRTGEDVVASWRLQLAGYRLGYLPRARVAIRRRASPRAMFRQTFEYGLDDPRIFAEFQTMGMKRPSTALQFHVYMGLVARLPLLWDPRARAKWVTQLGRRAGRLSGSIRHRAWYP